MSDEQGEMHDEMHDEMIERIAARLRPLPEVDPAARARVLVAVAAERERDRQGERRARRRPRLLWWAGAAAAVAAAALAVVVVGGRTERTPGAARPTATASAPAAPIPPAARPVSATLSAREAAASTLRPVELVFRAPAAHRVSVVGDFSAWDPSRAVMTRDPGSGLWSVTLRLAPGRHVYAFLVDDSLWVRDPRAPSAPDADFGRPGSVLLVGQP